MSRIDPDVGPPHPRLVLLVFVGGVLGTLARYGLEESVPKWADVPVVTIAINVVGAFVLGALLGSGPRTELRLLAGAGFLGAFTTYSSLAVDGVELFDAGRVGVGVAYLMATLVPGLLAAYLGLRVGARR